MSREVMKLLWSRSPRPQAAQVFSGSGRGVRSFQTMGSIIWPMSPSASRTTGLRYWSAMSKASWVRSTAS